MLASDSEDSGDSLPGTKIFSCGNIGKKIEETRSKCFEISKIQKCHSINGISGHSKSALLVGIIELQGRR